jgi:glycolate oxidase
MPVNFATSTEMIVQAKRILSDDEWDYINGAAESETSLRRNRQALDCLALRPRVLRDVRKTDASSTFQGKKLRMPVLLAPMGGLQRFTTNGGNDVDDAAEEFGLINFISTVTAPSLEEIAANSPHPKVFQIYVRGDDDWIRTLVRRVVKAEYWGVALTVDSAFYGNRERLHPSLIASRRVGLPEGRDLGHAQADPGRDRLHTLHAERHPDRGRRGDGGRAWGPGGLYLEPWRAPARLYPG